MLISTKFASQDRLVNQIMFNFSAVLGIPRLCEAPYFYLYLCMCVHMHAFLNVHMHFHEFECRHMLRCVCVGQTLGLARAFHLFELLAVLCVGIGGLQCLGVLLSFPHVLSVFWGYRCKLLPQTGFFIWLLGLFSQVSRLYSTSRVHLKTFYF